MIPPALADRIARADVRTLDALEAPNTKALQRLDPEVRAAVLAAVAERRDALAARPVLPTPSAPRRGRDRHVFRVGHGLPPRARWRRPRGWTGWRERYRTATTGDRTRLALLAQRESIIQHRLALKSAPLPPILAQELAFIQAERARIEGQG